VLFTAQSNFSSSIRSAAVLALLLATGAISQVTTGNISGSVEDSSGARVPNADITLVHKNTQQTRAVRTNERGEFLAALLPIGEYELAAEMPGFKRRTVAGILLRVDQRYRCLLYSSQAAYPRRSR